MVLEKGAEREKSLIREAYLSDEYFSSWQWQSFLFQLKTICHIMPCGGGI